VELLIELLKPAIPVAILLLGGRWLLNVYDLRKTKREQEIALVRFIRQKQYEAVEELYGLFGRFMELYRLVNSPDTELDNDETRLSLCKTASEAESAIDAAILRIGCEFTHDNPELLEPLLGNLRQSVQIWRESIREHKKLPFTYSSQKDYERFKTSFAKTAAYMVTKIYGRLTPEEVKMEEAQNLLLEAFSNKYEEHGAHLGG
jgi:hypothetical protein